MAAARRRPLSESGEFEREATRGLSLEERLDREEREASAAQKAKARERDRSRESGADLLDVPAAVVCARCGEADCGGCENELSRSGVVSVVVWERPHITQSALARLWSTARSTTRDAEAFFELLPDGPLMPALRFAAICELLAAAAAFLFFVVVAAVVAPEWLKHLAVDPQARNMTLRLVVLGIPAFAALLVAAHAAHGLSIDVGARRAGAKPSRSRALRFGLYACGWDLVLGPIGAVVVALKEGAKAALELSNALSGLPTRATLAFLRGAYRLDHESSQRALATSYAGAALATLLFAVIVVVAVAAALVA